MCRPCEALLYWKLASALNTLRREGASFRDVTEARDDIDGLSVCADHWRIRERCEALLDGSFIVDEMARELPPIMYEWPAGSDLPPLDFRRPDLLA